MLSEAVSYCDPSNYIFIALPSQLGKTMNQITERPERLSSHHIKMGTFQKGSNTADSALRRVGYHENSDKKGL